MVFYPDKLILKLLLAKKTSFFFFWLILCCRIKVVIPNVDFQAHKNLHAQCLPYKLYLHGCLHIFY